MKRTAIILIVLWTLVAALPAQAKPGQGKARQDVPIKVRTLLKTVKAAMDKEDFQTAVLKIREAAAKDKAAQKNAAPCTHPLVCLALGNCHLMRRELPQAEQAYLTALKMDPAYLDAQVNLARVYTDANRHAKAAGAFAAAYDLSDPKRADFLYYAAVMTLMDGRAQKAVTIFERLFAAHPKDITCQWKENYANALMTAELWKKAIPVVLDLTGITSGDTRIKWQETLLQIYLTVDDKKSALSLAQTLSRQAPTEARWWKARTHIHLGLGQYDKALDDLIITSFLTPLTREEKKLLADLSLQLEVPGRAARAYESLLADSTDKEIVKRLINAYRRMGQGDKALNLIARVDPGDCNPELLLLKGDVLYEAKRYEDADRTFRQAAEKNCPRKGQAWLMAGYAAWQYNDLVASRTAFEHAAQFKRHRKDALAAMAQLQRATRM